MADKIRANYPAMEEMAKHLDQVAFRLRDLADSANKIGEQMQGGVLQGTPGDVFVIALGVLNYKLVPLEAIIATSAKGIRTAMSDMQQADDSAAGDFK